MKIKSVCIENADVSLSGKEVADILYKEGILTAVKIWLFNNSLNDEYNIAFIEVGEWHDTELAYKTIVDLNCKKDVHVIETELYDLCTCRIDVETDEKELEDVYCKSIDRALEEKEEYNRGLEKEKEELWQEMYDIDSMYDDFTREGSFDIDNVKVEVESECEMIFDLESELEEYDDTMNEYNSSSCEKTYVDSESELEYYCPSVDDDTLDRRYIIMV